ncbi:MAG TPA: hypothetical protein VGM84_11895 [Steroidobacteraceae bacterium]|jgi:hypothetical protein
MRIRPSRVIALIAILLAHVLILRLLRLVEVRPGGSAESEPAMVLLLLPALRTAPARPPTVQLDDLKSTRPAVEPPEASVPAPVEVAPESSPEAVEPPAPIDWANEAAIVARRRLEDAAKAAEQAAALSNWRSHVMPGPLKPGPQFRWDYANTHRVESIPRGGIVINITDRCAIVFTGLFVLGGCRIGHQEVHGDLFEHMRDPQAATN